MRRPQTSASIIAIVAGIEGLAFAYKSCGNIIIVRIPILFRYFNVTRDQVGWLQNETTDQTASESCQSSDDDSDTGTLNNAATNAAGASSLRPPPIPPPPLPLPPPFIPVASAFENFENVVSFVSFASIMEFDNLVLNLQAGFQAEGVSLNGSVSVTPGYNEDLAEADQSRPEASHNHQVDPNSRSSTRSYFLLD